MLIPKTSTFNLAAYGVTDEFEPERPDDITADAESAGNRVAPIIAARAFARRPSTAPQSGKTRTLPVMSDNRYLRSRPKQRLIPLARLSRLRIFLPAPLPLASFSALSGRASNSVSRLDLDPIALTANRGRYSRKYHSVRSQLTPRDANRRIRHRDRS